MGLEAWLTKEARVRTWADRCLGHMRKEQFTEKGGMEKNEEQAELTDRSFKQFGMSDTPFPGVSLKSMEGGGTWTFPFSVGEWPPQQSGGR